MMSLAGRNRKATKSFKEKKKEMKRGMEWGEKDTHTHKKTEQAEVKKEVFNRLSGKQ